jgi:hypothetical protein
MVKAELFGYRRFVIGYWEVEGSGQKAEDRGQRFASANFTAGGREFFANRPREAGDSVLVEIEKSEGRCQMSDDCDLCVERGGNRSGA